MEEKSFEQSLEELERIVEQLENGEQSLDESIQLFEKGIALSKECSKSLENVKQRIVTLTQAESEEEENE